MASSKDRSCSGEYPQQQQLLTQIVIFSILLFIFKWKDLDVSLNIFCLWRLQALEYWECGLYSSIYCSVQMVSLLVTAIHRPYALVYKIQCEFNSHCLMLDSLFSSKLCPYLHDHDYLYCSYGQYLILHCCPHLWNPRGCSGLDMHLRFGRQGHIQNFGSKTFSKMTGLKREECGKIILRQFLGQWVTRTRDWAGSGLCPVIWALVW